MFTFKILTKTHDEGLKEAIEFKPRVQPPPFDLIRAHKAEQFNWKNGNEVIHERQAQTVVVHDIAEADLRA